MLWVKAKNLSQRPSQLLNIEDSYVAYCLDEAVTFFGLSLENKLEEAGHKQSKEERKAKAARDQVLDRIFGTNKKKTKGYADPALMFQ